MWILMIKQWILNIQMRINKITRNAYYFYDTIKYAWEYEHL